jgi:hypothetical protein
LFGETIASAHNSVIKYYLCSNGTLFQSSDETIFTEFASGFNDPKQVVATDSFVFVLDGNMVHVFDTGGHKKLRMGFSPVDTGLTKSGGITVDPQREQLFITGSDVINRYDMVLSNHFVVGAFGTGNGQMRFPIGVALSSDKIAAADSENFRVQFFSRTNNSFISALGNQGNGPGQFAQPFGVIFDSVGNIYVSDYKNNTVQKFAP